MKKFTSGRLGLLAIPLALLGVVGSAAFAASSTTAPVDTVTPAPAASKEADTEAKDAPETKDDASGPQEAPGTETAD
jgi:hypothetical protein